MIAHVRHNHQLITMKLAPTKWNPKLYMGTIIRIDDFPKPAPKKPARVARRPKRSILSYHPSPPVERHELALSAFQEYLRNNPIQGPSSLFGLWKKCFGREGKEKKLYLAVAAIGHKRKLWAISRGSLTITSRSIFLIGPK